MRNTPQRGQASHLAPGTRGGRRGWIVLLALVLASSGCAGSSIYMRRSLSRPPGPPPGQALVYFLRPSGFGYAVDFQIWDEDRCIGVALAKSAFAYACDPGRHLFLAIAENKVGCEADLAAGRTYYIIVEPRMGAWRARVGLIPVTPGSAYSGKAVLWAQRLIFTEPEWTLLSPWEESKREEARSILATLRSPAGRPYVTHLPAESGR